MSWSENGTQKINFVFGRRQRVDPCRHHELYYITLVESLQSHMILTMSHWSSGLPVCFLPKGTQVQIPWGDLCETGILLLALSRYTLVIF